MELTTVWYNLENEHIIVKYNMNRERARQQLISEGITKIVFRGYLFSQDEYDELKSYKLRCERIKAIL